VQFSLGAYVRHFDSARIMDDLPSPAWYRAIDADDQPRPGAWVAEATSIADLSAWAAGTRLILRTERPRRA
jgi:hypothetical protein